MKRTAMVGLLALASWSAQAAHEAPDWRVGAAASFFDFQGDDIPDPNLGDDFIDDNSLGFKLFAQYQFNSWFGLEGAYQNSGNLKDSTGGVSPTDLAVSFDIFSAQGLLYLPLPSDEVQTYLKAGYYFFNDDLSINGTNINSGDESGLVAGAGAIISVADNLGIRADFDWFDADVGDMWAVNLGLEYYFGGSKSGKAQPAELAPADAEAPPPP